MMHVLTDEEAVASSDEQIDRVARAFVSASHHGACMEALSMILWMVNGKDWISASDMARAKVRARALMGSEK